MNHNNQQPGSADLPDHNDDVLVQLKPRRRNEKKPRYAIASYFAGIVPGVHDADEPGWFTPDSEEVEVVRWWPISDAIAASRRAAGGDVVAAIVRDVCELDYTGEDWDAEKMLSVTVDDLRLICERHAAAPSLPDVAMPESVSDERKEFDKYWGELDNGDATEKELEMCEYAAWQAWQARPRRCLSLPLCAYPAGTTIAAQPAEGSADLRNALDALNCANDALERTKAELDAFKAEGSALVATEQKPFMWIDPEHVARSHLTDYAKSLEVAATDVRFGHCTMPLFATPTAASKALDAAAPAKNDKRELYECVGKGGVYEFVGEANAAGTLREVLHNFLAVYRDTKTKKLYVRMLGDFDKRMARIDGDKQGAQGDA